MGRNVKHQEALREENALMRGEFEVAQASLCHHLLSQPYSPTASCAVAGGRLLNQYDSGWPFDTVSARA